MSTGEFQFTTSDFLIPGRVLPIEIVRTYKNKSEHYSPFGYGWDLNYNMKVIKDPSRDMLILSNGRNSLLEYHRVATDPNKYVSPNGYFNYIIEDANGTCILFEKHGDMSYFNSQGKLEEIQDRTGNNSITFEYDAIGRLQKITNDTGKDIIFSYYGDRWTITDFAGRVWTYSYSNWDDLHTVTDPNGLVITYNYSSHNLTSVTDPNGQTWLENSYDANDKVTTQRYGNPDDTFRFTYDPCNDQATVTDRRDVNTLTIYNNAALALSETTYTFSPKLRPDDPSSYTTYYEYDSNMNMTRQIMPRGNRIKYTYDANGNVLTAVMEPNNAGDPNITMQFAYDAKFNFIQTATDMLGNTTTYDYDNTNGNLEKITYPEVNVIEANGTPAKRCPIVEFTYNSYGQVEKVTGPDGIVTKYEYYDDPCDPNCGRPRKIILDYNATDGCNITTEYKYDVLGSIIETNDPNGNITRFAYNILGKVSQVTDPCNHVVNFFYNNSKLLSRTDRPIADVNQVNSFNYDILDHVKETTDPLGYVTKFSYDKGENRSDVNDAEENNTHYEYDERNLLWKVTDANGGVTKYGYTLNGDLNDINDAKGNKTRYEYDRYNRLVKIIYADDSNERFGYDASSNVTSYTNRNNQTITYKYDALNRLIDKKRPNEPNIIFRYDIAGRVADVNDGRPVSEGGGITRYKYDRIGRVIEVNDVSGRIVKYEYDKRGLRTKLTYPDNSNVTYEYDELSRLTKIIYNGSTVAEYGYDELSRRVLLTYGNDANIIYQYDIANRLRRLTNNTSDTEAIDFNYADYDKVGNRLSMKIADSTGSPQGDANAKTYTYDDLYQLIYVDYNDGNTTNYYYDALGNRTLMTNGVQTSYESNKLNQYSKVADVNYYYDANGNLYADGSHMYYYDCENRLTEVKQGETTIVTYAYDYAGKRVRKAAGATVTRFCYDGDQIIEDYNEAGVLQRKYIYGPGIDEPICMIDVVHDNAVYRYHYDGLGSVVALGGIGRYAAIAAGWYHSIAIKSGGSLAGWGLNDSNQCNPPVGSNFVAIAGGGYHCLALKRNGSIFGWGENSLGQADPCAGNDFVAISAGYSHSLALKTDGTIVGWGDDRGRQTTDIPAGNDFVAIAEGRYHSVALKSNGSIVTWGIYSYTPPAGNDFVAIAAGATHALALKSDGSIVGWGTNGHGETNSPAGNDFVAISAGTYYSLALKSDGTIVGWGDNEYGQTMPPEENDFTAISAGAKHGLALKRDGTIVGWGYNCCEQCSPPVPMEAVERYSYDVYGQPTIRDANGALRTTSLYGNTRMFTGREYDSETGNYYYRARYYSPKIGRFLQTDPIGYSAGLNLYTYCGNNPLNWFDPYGLDQFRPWWMGPLGAIGDAAGWTYDALGGQRGEVYYGGGSRALGGLATMGASGVYVLGTEGWGAVAGGGVGFLVGRSQWKSGLDMMRSSLYNDNWQQYLNMPVEDALRGARDVATGLLIKDPTTVAQGVEGLVLSAPGLVNKLNRPNLGASGKDSSVPSQNLYNPLPIPADPVDVDI